MGHFSILFCCYITFTLLLTSEASAFSEEKLIYYDFTNEINQNIYGNDTERDLESFVVKLTGERSPNVFYSTDKFLHEMRDLLTVSDFLDASGLEQSKLLISFQILNNSVLSPSRFSDIFYELPEDIQSVTSLQKHLNGILVELNSADTEECPAPRPLETKWKISLPKYARSIGNALIRDLKVEDKHAPIHSIPPPIKTGVIFHQRLYSCKIAKSQQVGADFLAFGVNFEPITDFPWTYNQFKLYFNCLSNDFPPPHRRWCDAKIKKPTVFKINLGSKPPLKNFGPYNPELDKMLKQIRDRSEPFYVQRLQNYAETWTKQVQMSDLIIKNYLNWKDDETTATEGRDWFIPKLSVQEVDANPCQLETMLGTVANRFESVVVNEFTWSAFARHSNKMGEENCPNSKRLPSAKSPKTYLFLTPGIWEIWQNTEAYFEKLLKEKRTISGWTLQTLIFSSTDLPDDSQSHSPTPQSPVADFANKMKNSEGYKIGCAVNIDYFDINYNLRAENIKQFLEYKTFQPCKSIWNVTDVIIIEFSPPFKSLFQDKARFDNRILFWRMIIRELLLKEYPDKEVILHVKNSECFPISYISQRKDQDNGNILCDKYTFEWVEFQKEIQAWAEIHQVKIIFGDAFRINDEDDYETDRICLSFWNTPGVDGQPSDVNPIDCAEVS